MKILGLVKNSFGLAHAMIGTACIVAPIYTLKYGYLSAVFICLLIVIISYSTASLLIRHQGNCSNIQEVNKCHFQNSHIFNFLFYSSIIIMYIGLGLTYFEFGVMQLQGIFELHDSILNLIFFIAWLGVSVLIRILNIIESYISFGFFSIIAFIFFHLWSIISAPGGENTLPAFRELDVPAFSSFLLFSIACQQIVYAFFKYSQTPPQKYFLVLRLGYGLTFLITLFFCFGAFGIVNRNPRVENPETTYDYFPYDNWEVMTIQILYFAHLMTAGPFYMNNLIYYCRLITNKPERQGYLLFDILLFIVFSSFSLLVSIVHIEISTILELGGVFGGFFYAIFVPVAIHIKCKLYGCIRCSNHNQLEIGHPEEEQQSQVKELYCTSPSYDKNSVLQMVELCWLCLIVLFVGYLVVDRAIAHIFK